MKEHEMNRGIEEDLEGKQGSEVPQDLFTTEFGVQCQSMSRPFEGCSTEGKRRNSNE